MGVYWKEQTLWNHSRCFQLSLDKNGVKSGFGWLIDSPSHSCKGIKVAFKDWDIYNIYTLNLRCWFGFQILQMSIQLSICVMWWTKKFDPWRLHLTNYGTSFIANIVMHGNTEHLQRSSGVLGLTLWLINIYLSIHPHTNLHFILNNLLNLTHLCQFLHHINY